MATDSGILAAITLAFASCPRPAHFTPHTHCDECLDHDQILNAATLDSLSMDDVGHPAWDPICFVTAEALLYLFPALARLALQAPSPPHGGYLPQLLFHLSSTYHLEHFQPPHRQAVLLLLEHIAATRESLVHEYACEAELASALARWSATPS